MDLYLVLFGMNIVFWFALWFVKDWAWREPEVYVCKMDPDAFIPHKAYTNDAGWDLFALKDAFIEPQTSVVVPTGIALGIPPGYYGRIADRSSLAIKGSLTCGGGVIDSDYRGEVGVILMNVGKESYVIARGDRIAQLIITPIHERPSLIPVKTLSSTPRGSGKFGSTGK
jgi:dUTP pyrophosphatase